jgi:hypothetical protein
MDVCLPADFLIVESTIIDADDCRESFAYVGASADLTEDGYWLGAEAIVSPLPLNDPAQVAPRRKRAAATYDPSWNVV